jgi:D-alanyl-D-alanine carboxypeptidase (penicillin-binding protein 5/6)
MNKITTFFAVIALLFTNVSLAAPIIPNPPEINAKGYILIDYTTGKVIAEGNADAQLEPASLTKMMTSYIIGKELQAGNISNDDKVLISETAWAQNPVFAGSSLMWIEAGSEVPVKLLNQGIIVASGNDACVAMAEHIAGSESAFADFLEVFLVVY